MCGRPHSCLSQISREELYKHALKECESKVKAFVDCSKAEGLLVIFNCRKHNNEMNECLARFNTPENWMRVKNGDAESILPRQDGVHVKKDWSR